MSFELKDFDSDTVDKVRYPFEVAVSGFSSFIKQHKSRNDFYKNIMLKSPNQLPTAKLITVPLLALIWTVVSLTVFLSVLLPI